MSLIGMVNKHSPLNDSPLCTECNLPIMDDSRIWWRGVERVCLNCRNIRVEKLRKIRQEEIKKIKNRKILNVSTLKIAASATVIQSKAREKWGRQMVYLEATFSYGPRNQRIRYLFANDIPIYLPSWSANQILYLSDVTEIGTSHRECRDCGHELKLGEGIQWNYAIRLCHGCYLERRRTMKFGVPISPSKLSSESPTSLEEDSPRTKAIKLVVGDILRTAGGGMGIIIFNQKMQKMGYPPDITFKILNPDPRFIFIKPTDSKIVDGKIVRIEVGEVICIRFKEEKQ